MLEEKAIIVGKGGDNKHVYSIVYIYKYVLVRTDRGACPPCLFLFLFSLFLSFCFYWFPFGEVRKKDIIPLCGCQVKLCTG